MKVTLDTNAVINLCDDDAGTDRVVEYFKLHDTDWIYILAKTSDELKKFTLHQKANLDKLDAACSYDGHKYFTIGESIIGGQDTIRSDNATRDGIQKEVVDISGAYAQYEAEQVRNGYSVKNIEDWLKQNDHQSDAVLYERATELGCDYFVSNDKRIKKVVPLSNKCKPISLTDFLGLLSV